jgi:hypothetical protein
MGSMFKLLFMSKMKQIIFQPWPLLDFWCFMWSGKGWQKWHKACLGTSMPPKKLKNSMKTRFAFQIILFQKTLEFKHTITFCYGRKHSLTFSKSFAKFTSLGYSFKLLWILWVPWSNNVCWTKVKVIGYFLMPLLWPYHSYVKWGWIVWQLIPIYDP